MASVHLIESTEESTRVALAGRLDIAGVDAVGLRFTSLTSGKRKPTIVDLSGVEFVASIGMGMIVREAKALSLHGARMVLLQPPDLVAKALRAASIDAVLPIAGDLDEARRLLLGA